MKKSSNVFLNEPSKIQHTQSHKQKKSVLEYKKLDKNLNNKIKIENKHVDFVL